MARWGWRRYVVPHLRELAFPQTRLRKLENASRPVPPQVILHGFRDRPRVGPLSTDSCQLFQKVLVQHKIHTFHVHEGTMSTSTRDAEGADHQPGQGDRGGSRRRLQKSWDSARGRGGRPRSWSSEASREAEEETRAAPPCRHGRDALDSFGRPTPSSSASSAMPQRSSERAIARPCFRLAAFLPPCPSCLGEARRRLPAWLLPARNCGAEYSGVISTRCDTTKAAKSLVNARMTKVLWKTTAEIPCLRFVSCWICS